MNWKIEVKPTAEEAYLRLDKKTRKRIHAASRDLENLKNPFIDKNVRPLTGRLHGDYRLRVGKWRVLFTADKESHLLCVYAIIPRGDAY